MSAFVRLINTRQIDIKYSYYSDFLKDIGIELKPSYDAEYIYNYIFVQRCHFLKGKFDLSSRIDLVPLGLLIKNLEDECRHFEELENVGFNFREYVRL